MKQKIIITALPNGIASKRDGNTWQVSAAIGLQVEDANTTLQNVPDMLNWANLVKDAKFQVQLNGTMVEAKVVSKPVDTTLWKNLFSPTVKVKSFVQEDLSKIPIASYPIKHVLGFIKFVVEATGKNFSNDLPTAINYTDNPLMNQLSDYQIADFPKRGREKNTLDKLINKKRTGNLLRNRLNDKKFIPFSPTANPEEDFAQLKNFHGLYDKKEVKNFVQVPPPDFEFHTILSALSSYPQLVRRLGLVVDLEFTGPSGIVRVNPGTTSNIRVIPSAINFTTGTQIICAATAYDKTTTGFYAKPLPGSSIDKGHLKINADGFTVFQVDTDGAALKMCQQMDGLLLKKAKHIFYASEGLMPNAAFIPAYNNEAPRKEGLPTNRTAGIAVAKDGRAASLNASFNRMNEWKAKLMNGAGAPAGVSGNNASWILTSELLYADDINIGYRMDIQPEGSKWFSLHKRNNKYAYINTSGTAVDIPGVETDEGFIQTSASEEKTDTGTQLKVGEALARWEGWSLSVPRPGSSLNDPMLDKEEVYDKSKMGMASKEEAKYKTPGVADFKLNVRPMIEKGSLPMLRFGKKYAIKIRTVDIAGNSVDYDTNPENAAVSVVNNIRYMRYEPVDTPFLVLGTEIKDGESSEVVVIRSNEGSTVAQYEATNTDSKHVTPYKPEAVRHVKPPRTTVEMATTHGVLDKGFGAANSAEAAAIYNKIKNDKDPFVKESDATYKLKVIEGSGAQKTIGVEYLADPMAAGVSFFISANDPNPKLPNPEIMTRSVSFYFDPEVKTDADANATVNYDQWMAPKTFRVVLREDAADIKWNGADRTLTVSLPKGLIFKMNYACFWRPTDVVKYSGILDMMGMNNLGDAVGKRIAKGQHWMFSPWREITFIHAIQQPISAVGTQPYPSIKNLTISRDFGANFALLNSRLMVHGPSTDKLDIEAEWTEWIDDVTYTDPLATAKDDVQRIPTKGKVFHFTTLYAVYEYVFGEFVKDNPFKAIQHKFNDTKHRKVIYKSIATTRYREYFYQLIEDKKEAFKLTRESVVSNVMNIPSSARPVAPQLEYVIPTFEWDRAEKGSLIVTGRVSGLRIYLRRPWYSSGEGEQLGVVLGLNLTDNIRSMNVPVTTWGTDPTKLSASLPNGITPDFKSFVGVKEKDIAPIISTAENEKAKVTVIPYDVKYDKERQLYYADIMMNPVAAYYPFVRLALARYQANSVRKELNDCCLSAIVQADYIQIPAPRATSLQFGASKNIITVALSGTVPNIPSQGGFGIKVQFLIEHIEFPSSEQTHISINPRPIEDYVYYLNKEDIKNFGFLHTHSFKLPDVYASKAFRIKVLEYEVLTYDPLKPRPEQINIPTAVFAPMKDRLVFADVYEVNK